MDTAAITTVVFNLLFTVGLIAAGILMVISASRKNRAARERYEAWLPATPPGQPVFDRNTGEPLQPKAGTAQRVTGICLIVLGSLVFLSRLGSIAVRSLGESGSSSLSAPWRSLPRTTRTCERTDAPQAPEWNRLSATLAPAVAVVVHPRGCGIDLGDVVTRGTVQSTRLRAFEGDRDALRVVLVVDRSEL